MGDPVDIAASVLPTTSHARAVLAALHEAGWRIVRTGAEWNQTPAPGADPQTVFVMDAEWLPEVGVVD